MKEKIRDTQKINFYSIGLLDQIEIKKNRFRKQQHKYYAANDAEF